VLMLDLAFAVVVTVIAAYQWTGLARYWYARGWTTALATILWLTALRKEKLDVNFGDSLRVGAVAMPVALLVSIGAESSCTAV